MRPRSRGNAVHSTLMVAPGLQHGVHYLRQFLVARALVPQFDTSDVAYHPSHGHASRKALSDVVGNAAETCP